ncbi:MAG: hypothetical protein ACJ8AG_18290 [Ktedonobacteraceae bacterium]
MRITKGQHLLPPLLLVGLLIGLSSCGSAPSAPASPLGSKPDHVQIGIDRHLPSQEQPVVTLTVAEMVQQLYATVYALPQMPGNIACTTELGPHYTLTFYQGQKKLVTVVAENDGCRRISLSGEQQDRTAMGNKTLWDQLDNAIYEATPAAKVDWLSLMPTPSHTQPPQTARITSISTAQRLYHAILALPPVTKNNSYLNGTTDYQLIFHTPDQPTAAAIDLKQKLVALDGQYHSRGGVYRMNEQFKQLFAKTLAGVVFTPARPDSLLLSLSTGKTSGQFTVRDPQLIQKLYARIFTFPTAQPPPNNCLGNDKVAGKQKWYELTFLQWNLTLLHISAYEASCIFVTRDFDTGQSQYLQADQQFWTLLHQAANQ